MSGKRAIVDGVERYAIHREPNTVRCDVEGCGEETYVERAPADAGRAEAAARGWRYVDGMDLCPKHAANPPTPTASQP